MKDYPVNCWYTKGLDPRQKCMWIETDSQMSAGAQKTERRLHGSYSKGRNVLGRASSFAVVTWPRSNSFQKLVCFPETNGISKSARHLMTKMHLFLWNTRTYGARKVMYERVRVSIDLRGGTLWIRKKVVAKGNLEVNQVRCLAVFSKLLCMVPTW